MTAATRLLEDVLPLLQMESLSLLQMETKDLYWVQAIVDDGEKRPGSGARTRVQATVDNGEKDRVTDDDGAAINVW